MAPTQSLGLTGGDLHEITYINLSIPGPGVY